MAAANLLLVDNDFAKIFNCPCEEKKTRGCVRQVKSPVAVFKCPVCAGENKKCQYCKGTNEIELHRCPRSILDRSIRELVPFFFHFMNTNQFPDGKGRLFQPTKLIQVFDMWYGIYIDLKPKPRTDNE